MRDIIDMAKRLIKKEFEKIDENDVIFITHPGRMGDEDGSTFIVKKDNAYIPYRVSGWMYSTIESISYQDFLKHFPLFEQSAYGKIDNVYDEIHMGFGNRLYVKKDIYPEYDKYLKDAIAEYSSKHEENLYEAGIIFNVWDKALVDMANSKNINIIQGGSNE